MLLFAPAAAKPSLRPTLGSHLTAQTARSVSVCVATQVRVSMDHTFVLPSNDLSPHVSSLLVTEARIQRLEQRVQHAEAPSNKAD